MANLIVKGYFDKKQNNISEYINLTKNIIKTQRMEIYKRVVMVLMIWDMMMLVSHLAGNDDSGCITEKYISIKCSKNYRLTELLHCLHTTRNEIAHITDDLELLIGDLSSMLRSYKCVEDLQDDLNLIFKNTDLTLSAEDVLSIFGVLIKHRDEKLNNYGNRHF